VSQPAAAGLTVTVAGVGSAQAFSSSAVQASATVAVRGVKSAQAFVPAARPRERRAAPACSGSSTRGSPERPRRSAAGSDDDDPDHHGHRDPRDHPDHVVATGDGLTPIGPFVLAELERLRSVHGECLGRPS
jgi:hypothetical protein